MQPASGSLTNTSRDASTRISYSAFQSSKFCIQPLVEKLKWDKNVNDNSTQTQRSPGHMQLDIIQLHETSATFLLAGCPALGTVLQRSTHLLVVPAVRAGSLNSPPVVVLTRAFVPSDQSLTATVDNSPWATNLYPENTLSCVSSVNLPTSWNSFWCTSDSPDMQIRQWRHMASILETFPWKVLANTSRGHKVLHMHACEHLKPSRWLNTGTGRLRKCFKTNRSTERSVSRDQSERLLEEAPPPQGTVQHVTRQSC